MIIPSAESVRSFTAVCSSRDIMGGTARDAIYAQARLGNTSAEVMVAGMPKEDRLGLIEDLSNAGYMVHVCGTIRLIIRW